MNYHIIDKQYLDERRNVVDGVVIKECRKQHIIVFEPD